MDEVRIDDFRRDLTRRQFERAAELTEEDSDYGHRWSHIHEVIAEAAARRIGERPDR